MRLGAALASGAGFLALFVTHCVGDTSSVPDSGGGDATSDVASNDVSNDTGPTTDAGGDADAATSGKHAYVTSFTGALYVYDMPLSAASVPSVILKANFNNPSDAEIVPGGLQLLVVDGAAKKISIFDLPITQGSVAKTTITIDFDAIDGAFDSAGNFWVGGFGNKVEKFSQPFSNGSTPSQTLTLPTSDAFGLAIQPPNDLMFIGTAGHVYGYFPPDASAPTPAVDNTNTAAPTGIALNNGVFVSNFSSGIVQLYAAPFNSNESPSSIGGSLLAQPTRLKFSGNGSLNVADAQKGIVVLAPPQFTSGFVVAPNPDAGIGNMRGITFGP